MEAKENLVSCDDAENVPPKQGEPVDEEGKQLKANTDREAGGYIDLPPSLDIEAILQESHCRNVLTPIQAEMNDLISRIDHSKYLQFCEEKYNNIKDILDRIQPDKNRPFKPKQLDEFCRKLHIYSTSEKYRETCCKLFESEKGFYDAIGLICFEIFSEIRKFVLSERAYVLLSSKSTGSHTLPSTMQDEGDIIAAIRDQPFNCRVCDNETEDEDWIGCYNCRGWVHRSCAGLKQDMKWREYQRRGAELFECEDCEENG